MRPEFNLTQQKAMAIGPKFTAFLSILGSGYIVYSALSKPRHRASILHRIMLGMSCSDILASAFTFLTTWPIPAGHEGVYGAIGNTQTCTMQGFFFQLGVMTPMYNGFLALYYFLVCRCDWREKDFQRIEIFMHAFILFFGLTTGIAGIYLTLYNHADVWCWIASYPEDCVDSFRLTEGETAPIPCTRGDNADLYRWAFYYIIIWVNIIWTLTSMISIYLRIRNQEIRMEAYIKEFKKAANNNNNNNQTNRANRSDSLQVAHQSALYVGAFVLTWVFPTATRFMQTVGQPPSFGMMLSLAILIPSQGIFNFLVYIRPKVRRYRQKKKRQQQDNDRIIEVTKKTLTAMEDTNCREREDDEQYQQQLPVIYIEDSKDEIEQQC